MTLHDFFENVYRVQCLMTSGNPTLLAYRAEIRTLQRYFDSLAAARGEPPRTLLLSDLSDELLAGAMQWQLNCNDRSIPTANKLLRTIVAMWRFAKRKGHVATLPDIDRLAEPKLLPEAWSMEELGRIIAAGARRKGKIGPVPARLWWPAHTLLTVSTGVRISAVMRIESAKLDLVNGSVFVSAATQKQKADQWFDLKPEVCEVLKAIHPERLKYVFGDWPFDKKAQEEGRTMQALQYHFSQILRDAGLPCTGKDKFHKLRKTFATFIAGAAGEVVAQAMLGHSGIAVTRRYLDPRKIKGASARDLLPAFTLPEALKRRPESAA